MVKWSNEEINLIIKYNHDGLINSEISKKLNRTCKSINSKLKSIGLKSNSINNTEIITCRFCNKTFEAKKSEKRVFCSKACAASFNNKKYPKRLKKIIIKNTQIKIKAKKIQYTKCLNCGTKTNNKYCSKHCQNEYIHKEYIRDWENGKINGTKGMTDISSHIRRYLHEINNYKCELCGWGEINPISNKIPLHIHHKDGNCLNNKKENLQLLCPNCHSLTETFGNLNKHSSRFHRKKITKIN